MGLDGECLRLKTEYSDRTHYVGWPPGFTPHVHRGVVHVRNGAGRIIAQVGDELAGGGGFGSRGGGDCPGPVWGANSINATRADIVNSITTSVVRSEHQVLGVYESNTEHQEGLVTNSSGSVGLLSGRRWDS